MLHVDGLAAVLADTMSPSLDTQLARDILDFYVCESAVMNCIRGRPSPFEDIASVLLASDAMHIDSFHARVDAIGTALMVRLPRLVGLIRSMRLRDLGCQDIGDVLNALELCDRLLELRDQDAEIQVMQSVTYRICSHSIAAKTLPQSIHFATVQDFEALTHYWQGRLALLRLDHQLRTNHQSLHLLQRQACPAPARITEMTQLAMNIVMCADYAKTLRLRKQNRVFAHALVVAWGVLVVDATAGLVDHHATERTPVLSDLLLSTMNAVLDAKPDLTAKDMDIAADVFAGGLPRGGIARLYGL